MSHNCAIYNIALFNHDCSELFTDLNIDFVAPTKVLFEISEWNRSDLLPITIDHVRIMDVTMKVPLEI